MSAIEVILVDQHDRQIGTMEKLEAHLKGRLHRAISIYVFNSHHELLLQRRASGKYHCGGLWTNTCCGHPLPGEATAAAAQRRLQEEMGMSCPLLPVFEFSYRLEMPGGLVEHEFGHIFFGLSDSLCVLNPEEADGYQYQSLNDIRHAFAAQPESFTPWFKLVFPSVVRHMALFPALQSGAAA